MQNIPLIPELASDVSETAFGADVPRVDMSTNLSANSGLWNDKALQFEISAAVRTQDKGGETGS